MANLRYRIARNRADSLGQFFTPAPIASLLMNQLCVRGKVRNILDLGAGNGSLTKAALHKFNKAKAVLVEIDPELIDSLNDLRIGDVHVVHGDAISTGLPSVERWDILLSNPPYNNIIASDEIRQVLECSQLDIPVSKDWVRGDAAFLAKAWSIASTGSSIGLIIASPMIRDASYKTLRGQMVTHLHNLCVTQLEPKSFPNAEVNTFLLSGQFSRSKRNAVLLRKALSNGEVVDELEVTRQQAIESLDIDFHRCIQKLGLQNTVGLETLGSIGTNITRGSKSNRDFERLGVKAFHTTDFPSAEHNITLCSAIRGFKSARNGDILIPRVGSRCLAKQVRVLNGEGVFTDSVYRLTAKPIHQAKLWKTINSSFGQEWRIAHASGSCAKHLTIQALQTMPLVT